MDIFETKDLVYLGFLGVALYSTYSSAWRKGLAVGIEAGVEGTVDSLVENGIVEIDKDGEVIAKKS